MRKGCSFFLAVIAAVCITCVNSRAQTDWGYRPTNAFPGLLLTNAICLASPPGETNRLFVVEKHGRIIVITNLAAPTRTIFLNISSRVTFTTSETDIGDEQGLLGLAFHPGYATNRLFYVFYTGPATNGNSGQLHDILSCFQTTSTNANVADPNSEVRLIAQYDEANNHNAGDLHFGADGYLYVSLGDEGGGGDTYANSQRIDKDFFSAIMRLDVNKLPGNLPPNPHISLPSLTNYFIPADNPWLGATQFNGVAVNSTNVRTEFWAVGMRNPWRYSFDPATGELYLGHVGQVLYEWVDIVTNGANCGWNYFEGSHAYSGTHTGFPFTQPLVEYGHGGGRVCVIGGVVCRGTRWVGLNGAYLYADYGSGEVWALRHNGTNVTQNTVLFTDSSAHPSCFAIDPSNGDPLYAAIKLGTNSIIERIVATNSVPSFTAVRLSGTNLIMSGTNGPHSGGYIVLTGTNLAAATTNWVRAVTNPFDSSGNFNFTNPINTAGTNGMFYMLQLK